MHLFFNFTNIIPKCVFFIYVTFLKKTTYSEGVNSLNFPLSIFLKTKGLPSFTFYLFQKNKKNKESNSMNL